MKYDRLALLEMTISPAARSKFSFQILMILNRLVEVQQRLKASKTRMNTHIHPGLVTGVLQLWLLAQ